jgi:hypothetical protein
LSFLALGIPFGATASLPTPSRPIVLRDYDGDGRYDLTFVGQAGTPGEGFVRIQIMNGLAPGATAFVPTAGGAYELVGAGDVDGDGVTDLVLQGVIGSPAQGIVCVDFIDPVSLTVASQAFLGDGDGAWRLFDLADLDGDGRMDFVFVGAAGTPAENVIRLLVTDAGVPTANGYVEMRTVGELGGFTDLDGDGRDDLVTQSPSPKGGTSLRFYRTDPGGVSVTLSLLSDNGFLTAQFSNPGWSLVGIGRDAFFSPYYTNGPGLVAMVREIYLSNGSGRFEMILTGEYHDPRRVGWFQAYDRILDGPPPFAFLGFANVNGDTIADELTLFADGSLVERPVNTITPITSGPPFELVTAGDVDADGRWDLIYAGIPGSAVDGVVRIDHSGPTGFPDGHGWVSAGGGAWQLF